MNATSHILYGDSAARYRAAGSRPHGSSVSSRMRGATLFWAAAFETALFLRPPQNRLSLLRQAASIGVLAAAVDYTITPKAFHARLGIGSIERRHGRGLRGHGRRVRQYGGGPAKIVLSRDIDVVERDTIPWPSVVLGYGPMLPLSRRRRRSLVPV